MRRCFGIGMLAMAILAMAGGADVFLQSVAWTRMFVDFSQTDTLGQALTKTFDGEHKCSMCRQLEKLRQDHQPDPSHQLEHQKLELKGLVSGLYQPLERFPDHRARYHHVPAQRMGSWRPSPDLPPPRFA